MQHAVDAYNQTAKVAVNPREREADLLLKAAAQLQFVHDDWDAHEAELDAVLNYNRRLWTVFLGSIARPDNPLPLDVKNNIASLGTFILHHTLMIQKRPTAEMLTPLININREIAAGLHGSA